LAGKYTDPCDYATKVLKVGWTDKQKEIARALLSPPYKVLVKASHGVGKTFLAASLVNYWYDSFDPSAVITTAPTARDVRDLLWREVRLQRDRRGGFAGAAAPVLGRVESDHYAKGFTAATGESFQGRHQERMLFIFDEAVGVDAIFWETTKSMFDPSGKHAWLVIFNPTDTSSQAYQEEASGEGWHVVTMSALEHPNVGAALAGEQPPYPGAVSLAQLHEWVRDWCTPIDKGEARATDLEWPPDSGRWWRPGPLFESRALGRWPSAGTYGVWSDLLFAAAEALLAGFGVHELPEIGCDPARFGDDYTAIHTRRGRASIHHERHNGWDTSQTAGRLKQLCRELAAQCNAERGKNQQRVRPEQIVVKVDVDGLGAGVVDQRGEYAFVAVSSASQARDPDYPNLRSQLWFNTASLAGRGLVGLARLPLEMRRLLRRQCLAPQWKVDGQGRCLVEPKEKTKDRLGASPDDADAMNLAYWPAAPFTPPPVITNPKPSTAPHEGGQAAKKGLFGKGRR
jgi:hypothetical protein